MMNCEEFVQLMHERLDQREVPETDERLVQHARNCTNCQVQLELWCQIAPVISAELDVPQTVVRTQSSSDSQGLRAIPPLLTAGLAVAILIAVVRISPPKPIQQTTIINAPSLSAPVLAQATEELDPVVWWRSVQDRDWVGETMPTVQSVKEGVAPLGRTLVRAVTILTIGGENRTS